MTNIIQALNIADCFTLAMDEEIRQDGLAGSLCGFALELDQSPDVELLEKQIKNFSQHFPVVLTSLQQQGKRFFWCERKTVPQLFYQHYCSDDQSDTEFQKKIIQHIINQKQAREITAPIEFHLIHDTNQTTFFIRWIHPFCDARGIGLVLQYLCTDESEQHIFLDQANTKPLVNQQLDKYKWWQKVILLFKGKRYIASIDKLKSIQTFKTDLAPEQLNYTIKKLSEDQTQTIIKQARTQVGLTGSSLYYIGCLMRALDKLNTESDGDAYCVPYAFNLRKQRAITPVIANQVCAMFAQAPREIVKDREKLFTHLKQQNKEAIRQQLDYAFLPLMWAGSWLSLDEYGKILRQTSTGDERSSFWFSDIGKIENPKQNFPGAKIKSIFHLCQVTTPPGIGFLCCLYQNQLILSYNFVEPLGNSTGIEGLHQLVLTELLGKE